MKMSIWLKTAQHVINRTVNVLINRGSRITTVQCLAFIVKYTVVTENGGYIFFGINLAICQ